MVHVSIANEMWNVEDDNKVGSWDAINGLFKLISCSAQPRKCSPFSFTIGERVWFANL